jgi:uncharacterized HAD superfamily protein
MRIGIDIDGVIVDTINFVSQALTKSYGYEIKPHDVAHGLGKMKGIEKYFEDNGEYLLCTLDPFENSVEVINEIGKEHEIYLISARFNIHYDLTINWLKRYAIKAKEILLTEGKSKTEICKTYNIELFIEDSAVNALEISALNIPVLLYNTEYNQSINGKGIIRCRNWDEIYYFIKKTPFVAV